MVVVDADSVVARVPVVETRQRRGFLVRSRDRGTGGGQQSRADRDGRERLAPTRKEHHQRSGIRSARYGEDQTGIAGEMAKQRSSFGSGKGNSRMRAS